MLRIKLTKRQKGFTLIEIMVAIGILVVLAGVSWAGFINYQPSLALSAITRNLTSDLRLAQQLAVSEQINHGIYFSSATNEYWLNRFGTTTDELFKKQLPSNIVFCQITGLSNGFATFNPYGAVLMSGSVCLINNKGQTKTVEIKPSGFVKIQG